MAGRIALVTGASRGIGAAIASQLASDGLFVYGTATTASGAERIAETLGDQGHGIEMRIDQEDSVLQAMEEILADKKVDVLVNNAGITKDTLFLRMSSEDWARVLETNLGSLHRVCKPLLRGMMRERWGRIINIGSVVGRMGNPGQANYVTSKAGIEGFTRSLAQELGSRGITVNCVAPGFIDTDMTTDLTDDLKQQMVDRIPLGRMGTVTDVASLVSFLVSDDASYITAQTIAVNGGLFPN